MFHVRLYFGPSHSDKEAKALAFAREHTQGHNLLEYFPEGKSAIHSIASMRHFIQEAASHPFESAYKALIIHGAERMLPSSANALLKTLEEPLESTIICLLTADLEAILPTIRSRCLKIACHKAPSAPLLSLEDIEKLREEQPYQWALEVDRVLENLFETYKGIPGASRKIGQAREAIFCHMKLKSAVEALHAALS